nr:protein FAR1-RELATED SEQUENCE 5-like [Ipomoea trifida]
MVITCCNSVTANFKSSHPNNKLGNTNGYFHAASGSSQEIPDPLCLTAIVVVHPKRGIQQKPLQSAVPFQMLCKMQGGNIIWTLEKHIVIHSWKQETILNMEPENLCSDGNDETDEAIVDEHLTCPTVLYNEENVMNVENEVGICGSLEGLKRKTLDEMYELYAQHSRALGFCIRKSTTRMNNNRIVEKYFVCSFQGTRKAKNLQGTRKSKNLDNQSEVSSSKGCVNENEFENCWKSMVSKYGLEDHAWFRRLYELKEKWCTALSKDFFSAGTLTSQRSESTNHAIGFNAKKTTSLIQFYKIFKEIVKRWRSNEEQDEFQASTSYPTYILPMTGLLKHAAELLIGKSPVHTTGSDEVVHLVRWVYSVVREEWTAEVFDIEPLKYPQYRGRDGAADRDELCN